MDKPMMLEVKNLFMKLSLQKYITPFLLGFLVAVLLAMVLGGAPDRADAQAEPTYEFLLEKKISDNKPTNPYTADEFSFNVSGYGNVSLTASTDDYASAIIMLPAGDYRVEEVGPDGFVEADWTVQWSGYGCDNGNGTVFETLMTVTPDDVSANVCRADNQFRGEPEPILGCMDPDALNYDPAAEEDDGSCEYENGGGDDDAGCTDPDAENYNPDAEVDDGSCTYDNGGGGGGGGGGNGTSTDQYRIQGYVWHDVDKNGEIATNTESYLSGWEVTATNGTTTMSTTTDETGFYYFDVDAGTWTVSETVMTSWTQSYPGNNMHVVTVPDGSEVVLGFPFNLIFSVAHAAVVETFGDYNFGNYQTGDSGGGDGGGDGGGGSSSGDDEGGISGGCYNCAGGNGGGTPQVLGTQVAAVPAVAPYAGHGGASANLPGFLAFAWPLLAWLGF